MIMTLGMRSTNLFQILNENIILNNDLQVGQS